MQKPKLYRCSICNEPCSGYGNNPEPVNSGRCCDVCNMTVVIPTRLLLIAELLHMERETRKDHESQ